VLALKNALANRLGLSHGRYASLIFRSGHILKHEAPPASIVRHVRALRVAMHTFGGSKTVLVESDRPNGIDLIKHHLSDFNLVEIPRCLFRAMNPNIPSETYIMQILADPSTRVTSEACPLVSQLPPHDEASLMLATIALLADGWPLVCSSHSSFCRVAMQMAANHQFPPPVSDIHGSSYLGVITRHPNFEQCSRWGSTG